MADATLLNPRPMIQKLVGEDVRIRLKWGYQEYTGTLVSSDLYMNFLLSDTQEFIDGKPSGKLGRVFIRCNNVLWIGKNIERGDDEGETQEKENTGATEPPSDAEMTG